MKIHVGWKKEQPDKVSTHTMKTTTKWLMAAGTLAVAGVLAVGGVVVGRFGLGWMPPALRSLPKYSMKQTDSEHPWYRRTAVHFRSEDYVRDFDDAPIWLAYPVPTNVIGRAPFGNALVCSIPGQNPANYIAVDCGSEMEAYEVFRNVKHPPFDWRHATFQTMDAVGSMMHAEHKRITDAALIADIVRTLHDGTPTPAGELPAALTTPQPPGTVENLGRLQLYSDDLPGLTFCPMLYRNETGAVYLAESIGVEYTNRNQQMHANWIPANESFTQWLKTP